MPDITISILDDQNQPCQPGQTGHIVAQTKSAMLGYLGDAIESSKVLTPQGLRTGDMGYMKDGLLYVSGRQDDLVQIGGQRISTLEVEEAIIQLSYVSNCAVVVYKDELTNARLHAFVVPTETTKDITANITQAMKTYTSAARPIVHIVNHIPTQHTGKIDRAQLRTKLTHTTLNAAINHWLHQIMGEFDPLHLDLDSIDVIELMERAERELGLVIEASDMRETNFDSVDSVVKLLLKKRGLS